MGGRCVVKFFKVHFLIILDIQIKVHINYIGHIYLFFLVFFLLVVILKY